MDLIIHIFQCNAQMFKSLLNFKALTWQLWLLWDILNDSASCIYKHPTEDLVHQSKPMFYFILVWSLLILTLVFHPLLFHYQHGNIDSLLYCYYHGYMDYLTWLLVQEPAQDPCYTQMLWFPCSVAKATKSYCNDLSMHRKTLSFNQPLGPGQIVSQWWDVNSCSEEEHSLTTILHMICFHFCSYQWPKSLFPEMSIYDVGITPLYYSPCFHFCCYCLCCSLLLHFLLHHHLSS